MFHKYYGKGLSVIPIIKNEKRPAIMGWEKYCVNLPTEELIDKWSEGNYNIGLACGPASGVIALDIDTDDPEVLNACPPSPVRRRGMKGEVRFFKYNENIRSQKPKGTGIEILSVGNQVVLPPSIHPITKKPYEWITPDTLLNFDVCDLPELDMSFLNQLLPKHKNNNGIVASDGSRCNHNSHNELSKRLVAKILAGDTVDNIVNDLIEYDQKINETISYFLCPERKEFKTKDKTLNAYQFVLSGFGGKIIKGEIPGIPLKNEKVVLNFNQLSVDANPPKEYKKERIKLPKHRGLLQEIFNHVYKNSPIGRSKFAWISSIMCLSTLLNNRVKFNGIHANIYALLVCESGDGKNNPLRFPHDLFTELGLDRLIGETDIVSDNSILLHMKNKPSRLDVIDEASKLFNAAGSKENHLSRIGDVYTELYTSTGRKYKGKSAMAFKKSGNDTDPRIGDCESPCISLMCATTFRDVENYLSRNLIEKGLGGRFIYVSEDIAKDIKKFKYSEIPIGVINKCSKLATMRTTGCLVDASEKAVELASTVEAEVTLDKALALTNKLRAEHRGTVLSAIVNRSYELVVKLSVIDHFSLKQEFRPLEAESIEWAILAVTQLIELAKELLMGHVSENQFERLENKILTLLQRRGGRLTKSDLCNSVKGSAQVRRDALNNLRDSEKIGVDKSNNKEIYFLI